MQWWTEQDIGVSRLNANPQLFLQIQSASKVRPLSSTRITRLHRSYGPLRHPRRPGLSLARCQLIANLHDHRWGFPCCHHHFCMHAVANTPVGLMEPVRSYCSINIGRPTIDGGTAPALPVSGPAQRSLHVTAHMLAKSPTRPSTPEAPTVSLPLPPLRLLPGGTNQIPGGICNPQWNSACHGARQSRARDAFALAGFLGANGGGAQWFDARRTAISDTCSSPGK